MKNINSDCAIGIVAVALLLAAPLTASAENYKCRASDGKIEYSDRPCDNGKEVLSRPRAGTGLSASPPIAPIALLESLFREYEPRLCEREMLATEIDLAQRSGGIKSAEAVWKPKQERLTFLNDTLIEFQDKTSKVSKGTASDSPEMTAVRKFQRKLKECGQIKQ